MKAKVKRKSVQPQVKEGIFTTLVEKGLDSKNAKQAADALVKAKPKPVLPKTKKAKRKM